MDSPSRHRLLDVMARWWRYDTGGALAVTGQTGGIVDVARVAEHEGRWRWWAAGTSGDCVQRGDAERLSELRLRYSSHEEWMAQVTQPRNGYEWANVRSMHATT